MAKESDEREQMELLEQAIVTPAFREFCEKIACAVTESQFCDDREVQCKMKVCELFRVAMVYFLRCSPLSTEGNIKLLATMYKEALKYTIMYRDESAP